MDKIIKNVWRRAEGEAYETARILDRTRAPEGFDVARHRFDARGTLVLDAADGHLASVLRGHAEVDADDAHLSITGGVHLYLPPGVPISITGEPGTELVRVSAPAARARGTELLVRDETFLSACATETHALRWILTPQYLSRRVFLHHDPVLVSRSGHPVSWFRTTMFDVAGLPPNQEGEPVFKMSYNSRTEFNVIYEVEGDARVRFAEHPYGATDQAWTPWVALDRESTYHLDETPAAGQLRNKHEVYAAPGGHVTLLCLFDPAPVGIERHRPGEYSDYEPMSAVLATPEYAVHQREIAAFDRMVDALSRARACGVLSEREGSPEWALYRRGVGAQAGLEAALAGTLGERRRVIEPWMSAK